MNLRKLLQTLSKTKRDSILFGVGMAGIVSVSFNSVVNEQAPDAVLVYLFGAMVGLPVFLNVDETSKNGPSKPGSGGDTGGTTQRKE